MINLFKINNLITKFKQNLFIFLIHNPNISILVINLYLLKPLLKVLNQILYFLSFLIFLLIHLIKSRVI